MKKTLVFLLATVAMLAALTACGKKACTHTYVHEVVASTCFAEGYTKHTCSACGDTYNDAVTAKTHHRFNGAPCPYCGTAEITESITPDTEWYSVEKIQFTLTTAEQLAGLAKLVNEGTDFTSQVIYLEADIDLGYKEWIPIGNAEQSFKGTFNGNGHTISGLKIHAEASYLGLFGNNAGNIFDFTVANATIYQKDAYENIAIVCGYTSTALANVSASGFIDVPRSKNVGAIAGQTTAQISKVSSSAVVTAAECVGGIAGKATFASAILSEITNTGAVSGGVCTGGLMGWAQASGNLQTDKISNTGDVKGTTEVGGIFGRVNGKIGSMVYDAKVSADITGEYCVGGIVGKTESVAISHCSNEGSTVSASSYYSDGTNLWVWLGGYVGYGYSVDNCVNAVEINYNLRGTDVGGIAGILINAVTNCENTANIHGFDSVGGISGVIYTNVALNINNLKNSGNISGNSNVGGIVGYYGLSGSAVATTLSSLENSGAITGAAYNIGGIIGYHDNKTGTINASHFKNTGDITGGTLDIGGLFGYVIGSTSSVIQNSSSSADIVGNYKVGGLVGVTTTVAIKNCSNEGTTVTAKGWQTNGDTDYVWLGGYAGQGYTITGCTNNANIVYEGTGIYVGGIVGYTTSYIQDCTNNGNINASKSIYVGGIAGWTTAWKDQTYSNLSNTGAISGKSSVGGIFGELYQAETTQGSKHDKEKHVYYYTVTLKTVSNAGTVTASDRYAGGIAGIFQIVNTWKGAWSGCCYRYDKCSFAGGSLMAASGLSNTALVSGASSVGEMFGYFSCDHNQVKSTLSSYTYYGKVSVGGNVAEGQKVLGEGTLLSYTGGVLYVPETTEGEGGAEAE